MNLLYILTSSLFFIWIVRNILFWVSLWQIKEYRFDRLFTHIRETTQGRKLLFSSVLFIKLFAVLAFGLVIYYTNFFVFYDLIVAAIFAFCAFVVLQEIFLSRLKRPVITFKALVIIGVSFFIITLTYSLPLVDQFLWLLLLDRLVPMLIAVIVLFFSLPTEFYRDLKIEQAMRKIREHKKLLIIGVTGSYGKSSTKDYIAQILEQKFNVLKTQETKNTPIGISTAIISGLTKNTEIFVVEMGAYKRGEIAELCNIAPPKIGVLTAVSNQHLSLFGSLDNTMKAKYELIEAVTRDGISLFNGNNENAVKLYKQTKKKKALYISFRKEYEKDMLKKSAISKPDIYAFNVKTHKTLISFDIDINGVITSMKAPLLGAHTIENILPGIYIANYLGMKTKEIKKAVSQLTPLPKTMVFHKLMNGVTLINDTYNSSPDAVVAASDYMSIYKGKKMLVMEPLIELGQNARQEHYRIGKELSKKCNYLFLTKNNYYKDIVRGIADGGGNCHVQIAKSSEIINSIKNNLKTGDIVVFEGRESGLTLDTLL